MFIMIPTTILVWIFCFVVFFFTFAWPHILLLAEMTGLVLVSGRLHMLQSLQSTYSSRLKSACVRRFHWLHYTFPNFYSVPNASPLHFSFVSIGGSRGDARDASPAPLGPVSFIFMTFSEKSCQITGFCLHSHLWAWRPPSGKSWIHHWFLWKVLDHFQLL